MKLIFKRTGENVSSYNRSTRGYEFIDTCENEEEFYNIIMKIEENDYFPQEDGKVLNANGNEVFDPRFTNSFDDCDYNYYLESSEHDEYNDAHKIRAIKKEKPYNIEAIIPRKIT